MPRRVRPSKARPQLRLRRSPQLRSQLPRRTNRRPEGRQPPRVARCPGGKLSVGGPPMSPRAILSAVLLLGLVAIGVRSAHADLSPKVIKAFKGQVIVSTEAVSGGASDKETIDAYKAAKLSEIKGEPNADEVTTWQFHYTAFLK